MAGMEFVVIGEAESAAVKVAIMVKANAQTSAHAHFMATEVTRRKRGRKEEEKMVTQLNLGGGSGKQFGPSVLIGNHLGNEAFKPG